ncbi:hypothetical protein [Gordonia otitidis]|uniref:hypothetical protein n=1 Tax=Gordonia otitidis TaxID=249058 RepID=UPI001110DC7E|nr:hypothetical protein [Gordonia otitidis]
MNDDLPSFSEILTRMVTTAAIEVGMSQVTGQPPNPGSVVQVLADGMMERRRAKAETFVGDLVERVGEDALLAAIERDPERDALLWAAIQAVMASGLEAKRVYLGQVVANALVSDEAIDEAQLIVAALSDVDGPHVRALARLAATDTNEGFESVVGEQSVPVLATLLRVGALLPLGSIIDGGDGVGTINLPEPGQMGVSGVTEFGRMLLASLREAGLIEP